MGIEPNWRKAMLDEANNDGFYNWVIYCAPWSEIGYTGGVIIVGLVWNLFCARKYGKNHSIRTQQVFL